MQQQQPQQLELVREPPPPPAASAVGVLSKRKGVRYDGAGRVLSCRFCEILRRRNEHFAYEDEHVAVFRPLRPIAASHILIVPRAHIRNVHLLASDHEVLLRHMRRVAERVLRGQVDDGAQEEEIASSKCTDDDEDPLAREKATAEKTRRSPPPPADATTLKFAFHVPPFNSIDHVHMHAFRDEPRERVGVFGRVKYRTESWWCRSYDAVLERVRDAKHLGDGSSSSSDASASGSSSSSSHSPASDPTAVLTTPAAVCS